MLIIAGIVVGAIVLLGLIGFVMTKRQERAARGPGMPMQLPGVPPSMPSQMVVPGMLPNGRPVPMLMMMSGPRTGERVALRNGFLIGKQPGCDLVIEDGYTSTQHAQIAMDGSGNCVLYDRGSTNGTFVNGNRIQTMPLQHGVSIKIGSIEMRFLTQ